MISRVSRWRVQLPGLLDVPVSRLSLSGSLGPDQILAIAARDDTDPLARCGDERGIPIDQPARFNVMRASAMSSTVRSSE